MLRDALTIAAKDLRSELRTKEALNASLAFSIVILVLFSFAFDPGSELVHDISGGLLWMVFSFAGVFSGQAVRTRMPAESFRRWFLIAMILLGLYLGATAVYEIYRA